MNKTTLRFSALIPFSDFANWLMFVVIVSIAICLMIQVYGNEKPHEITYVN